MDINNRSNTRDQPRGSSGARRPACASVRRDSRGPTSTRLTLFWETFNIDMSINSERSRRDLISESSRVPLQVADLELPAVRDG